MDESTNNRRWLLRSHQLDGRPAHEGVRRETTIDTLLYYRDQLAAELAEVEAQLRELTRRSA